VFIPNPFLGGTYPPDNRYLRAFLWCPLVRFDNYPHLFHHGTTLGLGEPLILGSITNERQ
tara:strand:+ start:240 stop:419 length:180 start_codon:yes stop_codon:yes gene_type:complete